MPSWIANQIDVLNNIANTLGPLQRLVSGAAYVIGCVFLFKAIYSLKSYGESRTLSSSSGNVKEPLYYLLVGAVFIYLPTGVSIVLQSTFGEGAEILAYASIDSANPTLSGLFGPNSTVGRPLTMIIQFIGLIAFIRGWILIARSSSQSGQQQGGVGKGFMHIFGGILGLNIVKTVEVINATLYG